MLFDADLICCCNHLAVRGLPKSDLAAMHPSIELVFLGRCGCSNAVRDLGKGASFHWHCCAGWGPVTAHTYHVAPRSHARRGTRHLQRLR